MCATHVLVECVSVHGAVYLCAMLEQICLMSMHSVRVVPFRLVLRVCRCRSRCVAAGLRAGVGDSACQEVCACRVWITLYKFPRVHLVRVVLWLRVCRVRWCREVWISAKRVRGMRI